MDHSLKPRSRFSDLKNHLSLEESSVPCVIAELVLQTNGLVTKKFHQSSIAKSIDFNRVAIKQLVSESHRRDTELAGLLPQRDVERRSSPEGKWFQETNS